MRKIFVLSDSVRAVTQEDDGDILISFKNLPRDEDLVLRGATNAQMETILSVMGNKTMSGFQMAWTSPKPGGSNLIELATLKINGI